MSDMNGVNRASRFASFRPSPTPSFGPRLATLTLGGFVRLSLRSHLTHPACGAEGKGSEPHPVPRVVSSSLVSPSGHYVRPPALRPTVPRDVTRDDERNGNMTDGTWMSGPPGQQNLDKEPDDMDKTGIISNLS